MTDLWRQSMLKPHSSCNAHNPYNHNAGRNIAHHVNSPLPREEAGGCLERRPHYLMTNKVVLEKLVLYVLSQAVTVTE